MEAKKNPKLNLDRKKVLFFNIGLFLSLCFVVAAFEWKSYDKIAMIEVTATETFETQIIPITEIPEPEPPKPKIIVKSFVETTEPEMEIEDIEIVIDQDALMDYEAPAEPIDLNIAEEEAEEAFVIVEDMPEPIGGFTEFYKYVAENIEYPIGAKRMGTEGRVFVQFIVDREGKITNAKVLKGIGSGCDEEALRVIMNAPDWKAGLQRGKKVRVQMVVPINFKLRKNRSI